jgi:hypothetical protein
MKVILLMINLIILFVGTAFGEEVSAANTPMNVVISENNDNNTVIFHLGKQIPEEVKEPLKDAIRDIDGVLQVKFSQSSVHCTFDHTKRVHISDFWIAGIIGRHFKRELNIEVRR